LGSFSFHETKNIQCGEGGLLIINDDRFIHRAEILWEKGTNRAEFFRGEVNKYGWVDTGSSFLPSELNSAFLYAQLENIDRIQQRRKAIWNRYFEELSKLESKGFFKITKLPIYATNNAHMFYIVLPDLNVRTNLIAHLKHKGILSVFHYLSLHKSDYYKSLNNEHKELPNSDNFSDTLLRLPMYYELSDEQQDFIIASINEFFKQ
jgi:dTDP-4-amino-4,6-dideoxygalactose transaminase